MLNFTYIYRCFLIIKKNNKFYLWYGIIEIDNDRSVYMEGKKKAVLIAGGILLLALIVFFILGFLRKGPGERSQAPLNNISSVQLY